MARMTLSTWIVALAWAGLLSAACGGGGSGGGGIIDGSADGFVGSGGGPDSGGLHDAPTGDAPGDGSPVIDSSEDAGPAAAACVTAGTSLANSFDPTFDNGLKTLPSLGFNITNFKGIRGDSKQRLIVFGTKSGVTSDALAVRFTEDGKLDTTFGTGGVAVFAPSAKSDSVFDAQVDALGRVYLTGLTHENGGKPQGSFVIRFTEGGVPDASFGDGGFVRLGDPVLSAVAEVILPVGDGVLVGGFRSQSNNTNPMGFILKLRADGSNDPSFPTLNAGTGFKALALGAGDTLFAGGDHVRKLAFSNPTSSIWLNQEFNLVEQLAAAPDGGVLVRTGGSFGSIDATGKKTYSKFASGFSNEWIAAYCDGRSLVVGSDINGDPKAADRPAAVRLDATGAFELGSSGGPATWPSLETAASTPGSWRVVGAFVRADGKVIVAAEDQDNAVVLVRFSP